MDSKITKSLMDSGADSMIPNIANKESAFHYCGQSGNAAVICCWTKYIQNVIFGKQIILTIYSEQIALENLFLDKLSWKYIFQQIILELFFYNNYCHHSINIFM